MYLGTLGQGNGPNGGGSELRDQRRREQAKRCKQNGAASAWTAAKYGYGGQNIFGGRGKYWQECAAGYPEYYNWLIQQRVQKLVPTAEETAEAFVTEVKRLPGRDIGPPITARPALPRVDIPTPRVPPPPAPPITAPRPMPPAAVTPVDSVVRAPAPPAAVAREFPLMEQFRRQQMEARAQPAAPADLPVPTPVPEVEVAANKNLATILLLGIPVVLSQVM